MALGPEVSGRRWPLRRADVEAWSAGAWLGARRRLAARWMPIGAAIIILLFLVSSGNLDVGSFIVSAAVLVLASAVWPLDSRVLLETLSGATRSETREIPEQRSLDRKGWRAVVDAIPTAAVALDAAGSIVHHNRLVSELFPKIRNGLPLSQVSRNPDLIAAVDRALGSEDRIDVELIERVPVERRISATVSRLGSSLSPSSPQLLVTFTDLTEQDRLAQTRADFVANASHELRTPLASLRAFVETLQGPAREDAAARERFLPLMAIQAERMTRLIDDLLSLSRVEMKVHVPPRGIVEMNETAAYVCQLLEPLAQGSNTTLALSRIDGPARIRGEREEVVQVLQNLIQNAIKYGHEGGRVEVRVGRDASRSSQPARIWVSVSDNGPGIAPEHLPRLTERFYRVSVASSREKGGTGLGLAIVKHIVNRHRGDLKITSRLGAGSTFTVSFDELTEKPR
jgi:two-component system phosphate regulon sensor histidine kinase PhoR